jgi:hypothetical protein
MWCLFTPFCCVFLVFINIPLLCFVGVYQCPFVVFLIMLCWCSSSCPWCSLTSPCYVIFMFVNVSLLCFIGVPLVPPYHALLVFVNTSLCYVRALWVSKLVLPPCPLHFSLQMCSCEIFNFFFNCTHFQTFLFQLLEMEYLSAIFKL